MNSLLLLMAGFFLPLFPLSIVFNALLSRLCHPVLRVILILVWPQIGVLLLAASGLPLSSDFFLGWGLLTALFYAWRLLTVRDLGQWAAMLATSAWAMAWAAATANDSHSLHAFVLWLSVAPALLILIGVALKKRFGAAYAGLVLGLARDLPRLSALIVIVVLAAMALPLFPAFFALLQLLMHTSIGVAIPVLLIWLLWSWSGTRLLNGLVFGPRSGAIADDLDLRLTWAFTGLIAAIVLLNLIWTGA